MNLTVNGIDRDVDASALTPLLDVLRDELGVTGAKAGCHQGGCGACTVLVDGVPQRSCLLPTGYVDGKEITTVEGLGSPDDLSPIQQAFVHYYAAQCGFCTSGQLMTATALLASNPHPTAEQARDAMYGNLCRCANYNRYVEAVVAAGSASNRTTAGGAR